VQFPALLQPRANRRPRVGCGLCWSESRRSPRRRHGERGVFARGGPRVVRGAACSGGLTDARAHSPPFSTRTTIWRLFPRPRRRVQRARPRGVPSRPFSLLSRCRVVGPRRAATDLSAGLHAAGGTEQPGVRRLPPPPPPPRRPPACPAAKRRVGPFAGAAAVRDAAAGAARGARAAAVLRAARRLLHARSHARRPRGLSAAAPAARAARAKQPWPAGPFAWRAARAGAARFQLALRRGKAAS
jgi:hypothetical protein